MTKATLFRLRYQRFPVMDIMLEMTEKGFSVQKVTKVYDRQALPLSLRGISSGNMPYAFKRWYEDRMISADNPYLSRIASILCCTPGMEISDPKAFLMKISLLSYGRCMTDKFWIAPVYEYKLDLGPEYKDCVLQGKKIGAKNSYHHMDFIKNGIAPNFASIIINPDARVKESFDFNSPDLCTSGSAIKRWFRVKSNGEFWLEKYFMRNPDAEYEDAKKAVLAYEERSSLFPKALLIETPNGDVSGYMTKLITSSETEIVTLKEFIIGTKEAGERGKPLGDEDIYKAFEDFGIDGRRYESDLEYARKMIGQERFFSNAGFLVSVLSKEIIKPIAWM